MSEPSILHSYVPDPAGDPDYCAHVGDDGRCGWSEAEHLKTESEES